MIANGVIIEFHHLYCNKLLEDDIMLCWRKVGVDLVLNSQGVHSLSTVNIHVRAQKGYYLEQACTKCTYKRHIAIKQ